MKEVIIIMERGLVQSVYTNTGEKLSVTIHDADDEYPDCVEAMDADLERVRNNPDFKMIW